MFPSYSSFKNDILSFNSEEYILNLQLPEIFNNFIEYYRDIENEDLKKPIFSQTSKFKKMPNSFNKNFKYFKIDREKDDEDSNKNIWKFCSPLDENKKISVLVKTYLNKISEETYKKISLEFINEILLIENFNLFEILSNEIINKCLFDNKYRHLYINICAKIWDNKQIHYNLANIIEKENNYYWNLKGNENINGPFNTMEKTKNDIINKINYKKYFINYIQNLYRSKDLSFDNLSDEDIFIKKKKILLLVELISILYLEKYINFDIIILIIIDLLHINNFKPIEEIEYECIYNLLKTINSKKNILNDLVEYKNIFNNFIENINLIINNNNLPKRSLFFLNEIILIFNSFIEGKIILNVKSAVKNNNIFFEKIKNNSPINELMNIYKNDENKTEIIYKIIDFFINEKKINQLIIKFLIEIKNVDIIYNNLEKISNNIDDIMLDVPNANEKLLYLIENIRYNHIKKNSIINLLKDIDENSGDES
jgi:hypothetical protein